ncbi:MAG: hypothetical protein KF866_10210 [Phycisphaeraceae bacterium]|nr:hypothetical protein [Phycisphaeraceae bacterium]
MSDPIIRRLEVAQATQPSPVTDPAPEFLRAVCRRRWALRASPVAAVALVGVCGWVLTLGIQSPVMAPAPIENSPHFVQLEDDFDFDLIAPYELHPDSWAALRSTLAATPTPGRPSTTPPARALTPADARNPLRLAELR